MKPLEFSLVEGGPLYRVARWAGLSPAPRGLYQIALILAAIAWVPLLVLNAVQGSVTGGSAVPFEWSLGTHTRFLVTIPMFFAAEAYFDRRARQALSHMLDSGLVPPSEMRGFAAALRRAVRWRDSVLIEVALFALTGLLILSGVRTDLPVAESTWRAVSGRVTPAGWWYSVVALPIFQFLSWRWCWRLLVWWVLLWRVARLDLRLMPTHPDRAGGLGGLGVAHTNLAPLSLGVSAMLAATYGEDLLFGGMTLDSLVLPLAGIVLGTLALTLTPLLFFMPRLVACKQRGLIEYGVLAATYARAFDAKWLRGGAAPDEPLLGSGDIQSLADLANSFGVIRSMLPVPFAIYQAVLLAGAALVPMLPLLLTVISMNELIVRSVRSLVGL
ncbi:MAG TPA: hypothetical protein VEL75_02680 [Candidatus Methylomirabilis sp.]|nr:hypothetical protein [Candidatus Methylomirabilis sp.]